MTPYLLALKKFLLNRKGSVEYRYTIECTVPVYTQLASIIIGIIIMVHTTSSFPFNVDKQQVNNIKF
jgi:hypothetical protein